MSATRTTRLILAPPEALYAAFLDPEALAEWLPPGEMTGRVHSFDGRVGGGYVMSLYYPDGEGLGRGKTTAREDRVEVRFEALEPPRRIVQRVRFVSDDPALQGQPVMTVDFAPKDGGTEVTIAFEDLPPGVRPEDNDEGARLSLAQLARWIAG